MNYKIIKLQPENYHKCSNIWDMSRHSEMAKKWYDELTGGNRIVFIYTINDEFIAEGAIVFENNDADYTIKGKRAYFSRLIVKNEYRNQGIGSMLLDYLINYIEHLGYSEISIGVDADNLIAIHLYKKKGFTKVLFDGEDQHGKFYKLLRVTDS